jgi:hypothetical protein
MRMEEASLPVVRPIVRARQELPTSDAGQPDTRAKGLGDDGRSPSGAARPGGRVPGALLGGVGVQPEELRLRIQEWPSSAGKESPQRRRPMAAMPREPESFGEQVLVILKRHFPERQIELAGPMDVVIDGRHLGLENLYRMVLRDPDNGVEIVENYIE